MSRAVGGELTADRAPRTAHDPRNLGVREGRHLPPQRSQRISFLGGELVISHETPSCRKISAVSQITPTSRSPLLHLVCASASPNSQLHRTRTAALLSSESLT